ncbi:MAG: amidohydrolase [Clostridia bacterium]|nr:amidohydrolase [Clostridia bacterium]
MEEIKRIAEEIFEEIVNIRRTLHRHPELGFREFKTAELICQHLEALGIPYEKNVAQTGVVGLLEVDKNAKTLLMRADMDALPTREESNCPFKSEIDGQMHACGHDAHVSIVLGAATILSRLKDKLQCNVKFVFQPAEEVEGGAEPMIAEGVMENPKVDAAVGGHVMNSVEAGTIGIKYGEMMACPDDFHMDIHGRGGHGAYPHNCIDPIAIGVQILTAWNALSARYTTPVEKHLISTNVFQAGTCFNIIPDDVHIEGTVRVFNEDLRQQLAKRMKELAEQIAAAFGATCDFEYVFRYPPLVNDKSMVDAVRDSAAKIIGADNVVELTEPSMGGEDFAYFGQLVPSCFINYGTGNKAQGITQPLHNSKFTIDEAGIKTGMMVLSQFALDFA